MSYIKINAPLETGFGTVLSEPALTFIATLHDEFAGTIKIGRASCRERV